MGRLRIALTIAILLALACICYDLRAFSPYPNDYIARLQVLNGWSSRGYYAYNCSGFIADAHGEDFLNEQQMYAAEGNLVLINELPSIYAIREDIMRPGDIVAFHGPDPRVAGYHVAAFIKPGLWIDSDSRRGYVAKFRIQDKSSLDSWFAGHVRILRWRTPPRKNHDIHFFREEQEAIASNR